MVALPTVPIAHRPPPLDRPCLAVRPPSARAPGSPRHLLHRPHDAMKNVTDPSTPTIHLLPQLGHGGAHRSRGRKPVRLAMRASILGPISSRSWNANTMSGEPSRARVRWEPDWRLTRQPARRSAARTREARADGQSVIGQTKALSRSGLREPQAASTNRPLISGTGSPCSIRSAKARRARASARAAASARVEP